MTTRSVYPAADATSEIIFNRKLSSGMPSFQAAAKASKIWSLLNILVTVDLITETDLLDVLDKGCNGVRVATSAADEFSLCLYVHSKSLYAQMCVLVDSHGLQWPEGLAVFIQTQSGLELIKS